MPKIPLGNEAGLGEARYSRTAETPVLGRPVPKEVGPGKQVYARDVVREQAAPLSQIRPVPPSFGEFTPIQQGLDAVARRAAQFAAVKQEEIRRVNEAAERTDLLVTLGDQKTAYRQDTLAILNSPELSNEEKADELRKREEDFRSVIQDAKPLYQPLVASEVMGTISSVQSHAQDVFLRNQQDKIKSDIDKRVDQIVLDAAATGDMDGALQHVDALQGAFTSAGLTQAQFGQTRDKVEQTVLQNDIMGRLKSVDVKQGAPALASVNELLARLSEADENNVPKNWTRLDPATRNADIAAVINKKSQIESDLAAQSGRELTQIKSNFSVGMAYYSDALKNGDPVPPNLSVDLHNQAQAMVRLDPDKSTGYMALLQLQKAEREYGPGYKIEQAAKDPLFGTGVQPISFQDTASPEALQAKFAENLKVGRMVKDAKGLTFVPVLRNADMEGIARTIEASPANGILMVDTLKKALGKDGASSLTFLAGQMANSKDPSAPAAAAIIYNVAKGDMNTAQLVASGMEVQRTKAIVMPKDAELWGRFDRLLGEALGDNSANRGINFEAYKTAYAATAARRNVVDGSFDRELADEAFERVVGQVGKWNGSRVLLPESMDEEQFQDFLHGIGPETVQAWGGIHGMTNERAVDFILDDAQLQAVSPGRYTLLYDGKQALTAGGRLFIIDTNAPLLKPRQ